MSGLVTVKRALFVASLAFSSLSRGATGPVLIVHASANGGLDTDITANLTAKLTAAGYTVTASDGLPGGSLSTNKQVWDIRFNNATPLSGSDITAYVAYLNGGGSLFVMGENTGFITRNTSIASLVSSAGGGSITAVAPASDTQTVQSPFTGPNAVTTMTYAASASLASGATGTGAAVSKDASNFASAVVWVAGTLSNARNGTLIAVFDVNFMQAAADAASQNFLANLVAFLAAPPPPPGTVSSLVCNPASVASSATSSCTVTLSSAAPTGGSVVALSSNNSALTVPLTVTVAAGSTTGIFTATAGTVATNQPVTVTASLNATSATAAVTVTPTAVTPATVAGAPTLSQWAMMLLALGLMGVASRRLMAPGRSR